MLDTLEQEWRLKVSGTLPPKCTNEMQFFAWDKNESGHGVVICIGANYSQVPTKAHSVTQTKLGSWCSNYRHAAAEVSNGEWKFEWREHHWLVGNEPPPQPQLFIMTNLVPWVTTEAWTDLTLAETEQIVFEYKSRWNYGHLIELCQMFPEGFVIGHGINQRTLPYLDEASANWCNRMKYANLTYRQTPSRWDDKKGRFVFQRPKRQQS